MCQKFCLCTWQTLLFVQTVILLSDQSCDRENVEYKSQKIIAIFFCCEGSSDRKNDEPENDNEDEDSGAMPASSPSSSDIIPPSSLTQWPSNSSSQPQQPNQVSSRGRGIQRKTSLISSRGHRGRQTVSTSYISSHGDSQIDMQDTPEPSWWPSGAYRGCTGLQRQVQTVWKWLDMTSGGNYTPIDIPFQGQSGLRCDLQDDAKPIDFFNLYFTDAVIQKISDETNRYAHQFLETGGPNLKPYSIVHEWKDTNPEEVRTTLGVCVFMGLIHKTRIWMYWSTDTLYNTPFFGHLMTRIRFLLLNKFLYFQDNQHPGYDPNDPHRDRLFKIRDIMNMLKENFNTVYYPSEHITVDESLILFKGRLLSTQYIKSKGPGLD